MKILSQSTSTVTTERTTLEVNGRTYIYIEYLGDGGKVMDEELRNADDEILDDPALVEEIQEFLENGPEQQRRDEKHGLYGGQVDPAN